MIWHNEHVARCLQRKRKWRCPWTLQHWANVQVLRVCQHATPCIPSRIGPACRQFGQKLENALLPCMAHKPQTTSPRWSKHVTVLTCNSIKKHWKTMKNQGHLSPSPLFVGNPGYLGTTTHLRDDQDCPNPLWIPPLSGVLGASLTPVAPVYQSKAQQSFDSTCPTLRTGMTHHVPQCPTTSSKKQIAV